MKFRYTAYGTFAESPGVSVVHRPTVPIVFRGPRGSISRLGLVDTGSDFTLAPKWVAEVIGVSLDASPVGLMAGIEGIPIKTRATLVDLTLRKKTKSIELASHVHFAEQDYVLLGSEGFLEFFTATFDWAQKTLELLPNSRVAWRRE
jgi:hypothetical protein